MEATEKAAQENNNINKVNAPFILACLIQLSIIILKWMEILPEEVYNSISLFTSGILFSSIYYTAVIHNDKEQLVNLKQVGINLVVIILFVGSIIYGLM